MTCTRDVSMHEAGDIHVVQGPSADAVNASTANTTIPVVVIPFAFTGLTLQTFTPDLEQQLIDAIQASLSRAANVNISLANITSGSVNLAAVTVFFDGNLAAASQLLSNAQLLASVSLSSDLAILLREL